MPQAPGPARETVEGPTSRSAPQPAAAPSVSVDAVKELIRNGRYAEAEAEARGLLAAIETRQGNESLDAATALDLLCESLWRGGKSAAPESSTLAQRAITLHEQLQGPAHADLARSLNNLANMYRLTAQYPRAKSLFERALAIREKALGPEHIHTAGVMNNPTRGPGSTA